MGRQRDIFPLVPLVGFAEEINSHQHPSSLSRACQRRAQRRRHSIEWLHEGLAALNGLAGFNFECEPAFGKCVS